MLNREFIKVNTSYGEVNVKKSWYRGEMVNFKAEYEECRRIAEERHVPISEIYHEVNRAVMAEGNENL